MATVRSNLPFFYAGLSDTLRLGLLTLLVLSLLAPAYNVVVLLLLVLLLTSAVTTAGTWFTLRTETRIAGIQRNQVEQRIYQDIGLEHLTPGLLTPEKNTETLPALRPLPSAGWHLAGALSGTMACLGVVLLLPATKLQEQIPGALLLLTAIAATAWLQAPLLGRKRFEALLRITGTTLVAAVLLVAVVRMLGN